MPEPAASRVTVHAPATIGNFGPGFDVLSLAVAGLGDTLVVEPAETDTLELAGPHADAVPAAWTDNVACRVLDRLRETTGVDARLRVVLTKGQGPGSGLGSSASSAGGGALAFHALFPGAAGGPAALVHAAGLAEATGSGAHFDDVAAVVLGGLAIVRPSTDGSPPSLARVQPPERLHLAFTVPAISRPTAEMRALLPAHVELSAAVAGLARVAALVDAFHRGELEAMGRVFEDGLALPARRKRLPFLATAVEAALDAGAFGATLSGSGPAIVALTDSAKRAETIAGAMTEALVDEGTQARALHARPEGRVMHDAVQVR